MNKASVSLIKIFTISLMSFFKLKYRSWYNQEINVNKKKGRLRIFLYTLLNKIAWFLVCIDLFIESPKLKDNPIIVTMMAILMMSALLVDLIYSYRSKIKFLSMLKNKRKE